MTKKDREASVDALATIARYAASAEEGIVLVRNTLTIRLSGQTKTETEADTDRLMQATLKRIGDLHNVIQGVARQVARML